MPDYMFLLESRLSPEQRDLLARVQQIAQAQETNAYLTGGAVRDLITGMPIRDLDITVEGSPARLARELAEQGARIVTENERLRHLEMVYHGETDFSLQSARDEVYARPGARPEARWATITDDLRRRDLSINAIAISLNPASRGLLLDPTNGLADIQKREVRVLSMHSFTNQPIRLLRVLRYAVRLEFRMEARTAEWFALAMERRLHETIEGEPLGEELRALAREERCVAILKAWEARGLLSVVHSRLQKRRPAYDDLAKLMKAREAMLPARRAPRLFAPVVHYLLARLSPGERGAALRRGALRAAEIETIYHLEPSATRIAKWLKSRKAASPRDAYAYLESVPCELLAFILADFTHAKVLAKIRTYLAKWRPLRLALPAGELEALGVARGPKFDKILEDLFQLQLAGKGRNPQDRLRLLRQLAGIKPEPKKKEKEKEKEPKKKAKAEPQGAAAAPAPPKAGAPERAALLKAAQQKAPPRAVVPAAPRPEAEPPRAKKLPAKPAPPPAAKAKGAARAKRGAERSRGKAKGKRRS